MPRIVKHKLKRELINNIQEGSCLLCDYPLVLTCHLHHIIPLDLKGPDHFLNLIGLCPNHHNLLEQVRRHIAPRNFSNNNTWHKKAQAAIKVIETLTKEKQKLFNELSAPFPLRNEILKGVTPKFRTHLAVDIARKDAELLLEINQARPSIVLLWRIDQGKESEPKSNTEWSKAIDNVSKTLHPNDFSDVINLHLSDLKLPFSKSWFNNFSNQYVDNIN